MLDSGYLAYANEREKIYAEAVIKHGSQRAASRALGIPQSTISGSLKKLKEKATKAGFVPAEAAELNLPPGFYPTKVTIQTKDGSEVNRWASGKSPGQDPLEIAASLRDHFFKEVKPVKSKAATKVTDKDLMAAYMVADVHIGAYSWAEETGEDNDINSIIDKLKSGIDRLVSRTPETDTAVVVQLGDLLHVDDDSSATKRAKNPLDVDTRYHKVARVALEAYRWLIDRTLDNHNEVKVINVPGNHDEISSVLLGMAIEMAYADEPRVTVDNSPGPFFYHRFHNCFFGAAHGHTCKPKDLLEVMVADRQKDVGECDFRYWWTGHIHNAQVTDSGIARIESFRTLAPKDAWHHASGYRAGSDIQSIIYHKDWGEYERVTISSKQLLLNHAEK